MTDRIDGRFREAVARFHLHRDVDAEGEGGEGVLRLADGRPVRWRVAGGDARIVPSTWHPEFGLSVPSRCLEVRLRSAACAMDFEWD